MTEEEVEVIRATLRAAPVRAVAPPLLETAASLTVVSRCECGCASVDFVDSHPAEQHRPKPLGDGVGRTSAGGDVGVIVWGNSDAITGLEVYDLGAGDIDLKLPVPSSIKTLGEA